MTNKNFTSEASTARQSWCFLSPADRDSSGLLVTPVILFTSTPNINGLKTDLRVELQERQNCDNNYLDGEAEDVSQ